MFDNINKQSAPSTGADQNPEGGMPQSPAGQGGISDPAKVRAEDIFAETEKDSGFGFSGPVKTEKPQPIQPFQPVKPEKPAIFQPKEPGAETIIPSSGGLFGSPAIKIIGLIILALVFVGGGTWYVYTKLYSSKGGAANIVGNEVGSGSANEAGKESGADKTNEAASGQSAEETPQPAAETTPAAPVIKDTDQDGLTDEEERQLGTDINSNDSDNDGLFDREEVQTYKTDPLNNDTDGDGYIDGNEVGAGYDPKGAGKLLDFGNAVE